MGQFILITAAGRDRPGIVSGISRILFETGCNIEDTSMTRLREEFAMMLIVSLPGNQPITNIRRRLKKAQRTLGLSIALKPLRTNETRRVNQKKGRPYLISVYGADRPGIVHRVTRLMASNDVNISDLNTRVIGPAEKPLYVMILEVEVPPRLKIPILRARLKKLKAQVNVDITLHRVEVAQL